jgi:hypothetical protein
VVITYTTTGMRFLFQRPPGNFLAPSRMVDGKTLRPVDEVLGSDHVVGAPEVTPAAEASHSLNSRQLIETSDLAIRGRPGWSQKLVLTSFPVRDNEHHVGVMWLFRSSANEPNCSDVSYPHMTSGKVKAQ